MISHPDQVTDDALEVARFIIHERTHGADYTNYSYQELVEAKESINAEKYPVKARQLVEEFKKRDLNENIIDIAEKDLFHINQISKYKIGQSFSNLKVRPDVNFLKYDYKKKDFLKTDIDHLILFISSPGYYDFIQINDGRIELQILHNGDKNENGFKFFYFDTYEKKNYESILHGFSKEFAITFLINFIEKGHSSFSEIEWRLIEKNLLRFLYSSTSLVLLIGFIVMSAIYKFLPESFLAENLSTHLFDTSHTKSYFFIFLTTLLGFKLIEDRHQVKNLSKLSTREKYDTISSYFVLIIMALFVYYMVLPEL